MVPEATLEAYAILAAMGRSGVLQMAAEGAMTFKVRAFGNGLAHVNMVGWVPTVAPYLERARAMVVPLLYGRARLDAQRGVDRHLRGFAAGAGLSARGVQRDRRRQCLDRDADLLRELVELIRRVDGALGPRTAAMIQPYENEPENRGILNMDGEELFEHCRRAADVGLGMTVHAIGDRANHEVLDAYEQLRSYETEHHLPHLRHRIEHVQVLHPDDAPRLSRLNVIASMQPIHATSDMYMADKFWGARSRLAVLTAPVAPDAGRAETPIAVARNMAERNADVLDQVRTSVVSVYSRKIERRQIPPYLRGLLGNAAVAVSVTATWTEDLTAPVITATLTLANTAAGVLTTGTFGASTSSYNSGTGVWTVSGTLTDVKRPESAFSTSTTTASG